MGHPFLEDNTTVRMVTGDIPHSTEGTENRGRIRKR